MSETKRRRLFAALLMWAGLGCPLAFADPIENLGPGTGPRHAIAMHGSPLYGEGFRGFGYIDPAAEQGGEITLGVAGTFDSLNPFIVQGNAPTVALETAYSPIQTHTIEGLMTRGHDDPFALYGLLAETIEIPNDRSWVEFRLNPAARFSDGSQVTIDDVIFSFEILRDKGRPNTRRYYNLVKDVLTPGDNRIRFVFSKDANTEMPLIMGLMSVFPKKYWETRDFDKSSLEPLIGSGPYIITNVDPGRQVIFQKNQDYWGRDLPVNRGLNNFDLVKYEYYRDDAALFEAFKASQISVRVEQSAKNWATSYNFPATLSGQVVTQEIPHGRTADMYAMAFNTRRDIFSDVAVRDAFILLFDFEWMNQNFFYGEYKRLRSYFDNSELGSTERPADEAERDLLDESGAYVRRDILEAGWRPPLGGSPEIMRNNKRLALKLFSQAGWQVKDGKLVNDRTGQPMSFEIMIADSADEKVALNYASTLETLGIEARVKLVEPIQYQVRRETYDFDMTPLLLRGTLSPGNEQAFRFGSKEADIEGTYNLAGVSDSAVDRLIDAVTNAQTRQELVTATRALDRALLSGSYMIPLYYTPVDRVAYWSELQIPPLQSRTGLKVNTWWVLPDN